MNTPEIKVGFTGVNLHGLVNGLVNVMYFPISDTAEMCGKHQLLKCIKVYPEEESRKVDDEIPRGRKHFF